jgi:hypothetical protein
MMMIRMRRYMKEFSKISLVIGILIFSGSFCMKAQQKDFQSWTSAGIDAEVIKNLKVSLTEEIRLKENSAQLSQQINDIGVSYRFSKYLKAALYYRLEAKWQNPDEYNWRQGFYGDVSARYEVSQWTIGYRLRIQSDRIEFNENADELVTNLVNRHKFQVDYNIPGFPVTPFAEEELFVKSENHEMYLSNFRTWLGFTWSPGKMHEFSLKYGIDQERMEKDPLTAFILAFNYTLKLKL